MMLRRIGEKLDTNLIRHEDIVDKVEKELQNRRFLRVYKHVDYVVGKCCGEIDVVAKRGGYVLLFEVKGYDSLRHYNRAVKQLRRAERMYNGARVFLIYAYGNHYGLPEYKWIRRNKK